MVRGSRIWALLAVLFWGVGFYGITDLLMPFGATETADAGRGLEASWGVFFTVIVSGAFLRFVLRPGDRQPCGAQLWVAVGTLLLAAAVTGSSGPLKVAAMLAGMTLALSYLDRPGAARAPQGGAGTNAVGTGSAGTPRLEVSGQLFLLALGGTPWWWGYAAVAAESYRLPGNTGGTVWGVDHWPVQAALGFFLSLAVLMMAFLPPVRRLFALSCCAGSATLGFSWLLHPQSAGAVDNAPVAVLAVLWGFAVFACRNGRRPRPPARRPTRRGAPAPGGSPVLSARAAEQPAALRRVALLPDAGSWPDG